MFLDERFHFPLRFPRRSRPCRRMVAQSSLVMDVAGPLWMPSRKKTRRAVQVVASAEEAKQAFPRPELPPPVTQSPQLTLWAPPAPPASSLMPRLLPPFPYPPPLYHSS